MPDLSGQRIGFIGLGIMGRPMAGHLRKAGATLTIHNRSRAVVDELAAEGMEPADSPAAVARASDVTILMLPDTPAVERVLFGPEGVAAGLRLGALVIDMGTTAPLPTRDFAARIEALGGEYVDAPVSGGQAGAVAASLTIMAGGSEAAVARAMPVLSALGQRITHVGGAGAGQVAKTANQVIVGLTIAAVAEAFALCVAAGVDPARVREALQGGFASSRILELHGQRMIDGTFAPGARVTTQRKDLAQALDLAAALDLELPVTELGRELYERLIERGDGGLDHSALYRLYVRG
jgi:2-hydroxy-3-oxopropionate reductase